jgi:hypothetical protein
MGRYITTTGTAGSVIRYNAGVGYTAQVNDRIICTAGGQTITLPATSGALDGDTVQIVDATGAFGSSNCTVAQNGAAYIANNNGNLTLNVNYCAVTLVYSSAYVWLITSK